MMNTKKIKNLIAQIGLSGVFFSTLLHPFSLCGEEGDPLLARRQHGYCINFHDVPVIEFVRFVSRISEENFIFDSKDLNFDVSLSTGKSVSPTKVVQALIQLLKMHQLAVFHESGYYVIRKATDGAPAEGARRRQAVDTVLREELQKNAEGFLVSNASAIPGMISEEIYEFFVYKLKYHEGEHIVDALKKIAADLRSQPDSPLRLINAIQSLQWVKSTNSLLCSTDAETLVKLRSLIDDLDKPLRQVFIEVLVVETDVKKNLEFGLQWAASGTIDGKLGFGGGNFAPGSPFGKTMQSINATNTPTGLNQVPTMPGFDLGVIGDIIMHKGKSFLSLGSLVSALQADASNTIVLNQKMITQDNKNSTIFVGDNIPFTGSVVTTTGQTQQTSANIEYRDVGVSLSITPRLGEGDIITLEIDEVITEAMDHNLVGANNTTVNGIRTTKMNTATHVHVPDKHFLVLSGMIRNTKARHKTGIPCLGGLPFIGALFSKTHQGNEKRNVIIFVRPRIIHSFAEYQDLSDSEKERHSEQAAPGDFSSTVEAVCGEN